MKKDYLYVIGMIVTATVVTIYLFNLPKQVLKEKNRQLETEEAPSEEAPQSEPSHLTLSKKQ